MRTVKKFSFTPVLGWSTSRYDLFRACKRRYFYTYYGKYDDSVSAREIEALKRMTTIPLETGNIVHDVIEVLLRRLLKTGEPIDYSRFWEYARQTVHKYCREKTFSEVFYRERQAVEVASVYGGVRTCLTNFLRSDRFRWLMKMARNRKEDWIIEPEGFGETRIDGLKAYCKVDFLFPIDDRLVILDWKTGKENAEKHRKQLLAYSSWAAYHFGRESASILPTVAYLQPVYSEKTLEFDARAIEAFSLNVKEETHEMYAYCRHVEQNIPKEKGVFEKTPNQRLCAYCNFRILCAQP